MLGTVPTCTVHQRTARETRTMVRDKLDVMLDTETLGTRPGCVVMSVALVTVDEKQDWVTRNISVEDQGIYGLVIDPLTLSWWGSQPESSYDACRTNSVDLRPALLAVNEWLVPLRAGRPVRLWCHGAGFDASIVEELYRRARVCCPWKYWDVRDTRTVYDLAGVDLRTYSAGVKHCALDDAKNQAAALLDALKRLGT